MPIPIIPSYGLLKKWWKAGTCSPGTPRFYAASAMALAAAISLSILAYLGREQLRQNGLLAYVQQVVGSGKDTQSFNDPAGALQALRLVQILTKMETAQRTFTQKGDSASLEDYNRARRDFALLSASLTLTVDDDAQSTLLTGMRDKVERWHRDVAYPAMAAKQAGKAAAQTNSPLLTEARTTLAQVLQLRLRVLETLHQRQSLERAGEALATTLAAFVLVGLIMHSSCEATQAAAPKPVQTAPVQEQEGDPFELLNELVDNNPVPTLVFSDSGQLHLLNQAAMKLFGYKHIGDLDFYDLFPQRLLLHDIARLKKGTLKIDAVREGNKHFQAELCFGHLKSRYMAVVRELADDKTRTSDELLRVIAEGLASQTGHEFRRSFIKIVAKALQSDFAFITQTFEPGHKTCTLLVCDEGEIRRLSDFPLANTACQQAVQHGFQNLSGNLQAQFPEDELLRQFKPEVFSAIPFFDSHGRTMGILGVMNRKNVPIVAAESTLKIFSMRAASILLRKSYEEELSAEKERLAIILRSMGDGFITTDIGGRVLLMNKAAELLTGYSQADAAGRHLKETFVLLDEATRNPNTRAVERIIETGAVIGASATVLLARDGSERTIESTASVVRDVENKKIGVALVFRDVSERTRIEEERNKAEKLESLGVAAGGIAHDFNNLLTAIIGNISLSMLTSTQDESTAEHLAGAKKASMRAQELAQQLLTFAKGGAPIKRTASIKQLVSETVTFSLRGSNVGSAFEFAEDLWAADLDSGQISQVIGNLVINAKQAMPQGGTLKVSCSNLQLEPAAATQLMLEPGRYVIIAVEDKGVGISDENLKKIFDPYFTTKPKGSGLGLATAYSIVKNHDGLITVESRLGEGSKFTVYLPASDHAAPERQTRVSLPNPSGGGRILVLDDEEAICALVSHTLTPLGYEVVETNEPLSAIRAYEKALKENRRFDAVITDLTIPNCMGGEEALKELLAIDPNVKAIVSSGYANDPVMSRYKEHGFCACIAKPYEIADLAVLVNEVVHGKTPSAA